MFKTTSSVSVQPFNSITVNRRVAVGEDTWAVVDRADGESIVAVPDKTVQAVDATGWSPAVATPYKGKAVESPSVQRV